jgi:hypothetical protein
MECLFRTISGSCSAITTLAVNDNMVVAEHRYQSPQFEHQCGVPAFDEGADKVSVTRHFIFWVNQMSFASAFNHFRLETNRLCDSDRSGAIA